MRILRYLQLTLLSIAAIIVVTGGGRIGVVDFRSLDAWVIPIFVFEIVRWRQSQAPLLVPPDAFRAPPPWILAAALFTLFAGIQLVRMLTLHANVYDAGFVYQPLFFPFGTPLLKCDGCYLGSYLGAHQAFTFFLIAPIVSLVSTPLSIPFLMGALGFAGFALLYRSYRDDLDRTDLIALTICLLSARGFRESFFFDFREDLVGATFFFLAFALLRRGKIAFSVAAGLAAALSKETGVLLFPFFLGVIFFQGPLRALDRRHRVFIGLAFTALAAGTFYAVILKSLPAWSFSGGSGSQFVARLSYLGSSPGEIFERLITHPLDSTVLIVRNLATPDRFRYLLYTLGPLFFFAVPAPNLYYLPGLIVLVGNLVSTAPNQRYLQFHYELFALPFFAFGIAESVRRLREKGKWTPAYRSITLLAFLSLSGYWPMTHLRDYLQDRGRIRDALWVRTESDLLPPLVTVIADPTVIPLITDRASIRTLFKPVFDPTAHFAEGALLDGDAEYAFVSAPFSPDPFLGAWKRERCGPAGIICLFHRTSF